MKHLSTIAIFLVLSFFTQGYSAANEKLKPSSHTPVNMDSQDSKAGTSTTRPEGQDSAGLAKEIRENRSAFVNELIRLNNTIEKSSKPYGSTLRDILFILLGAIVSLVGSVVVPQLNKLFYEPRLYIERVPLLKEAFVSENVDTPNADTTIYCHLKCLKKSRCRLPAQKVNVLLIDVFQEDKTGILKSTFDSGPIPLHRQYEFVNHEYFHSFPTIRDAGVIYDLARISKNENALELRTHVPLPGTTFRLVGAGRIIATLFAESDETISSKINIQIKWDGQWPDTKSDIVKHLEFEEISNEFLKRLVK
jgi:hypothetical protein